MVTKYRKKPVIIEAMRLTTTNIREVYMWMYPYSDIETRGYGQYWDQFIEHTQNNGMRIYTLEDGPNNEAQHIADIGDYIIKGIKGEFYPCKPDIFELTYDEVI